MRIREYQREFDYVRKTYFPMWDRRSAWKLQVLDEIDGSEGRCESESKSIKITKTAKSRLRLILIHEIAHAAASAGHDKKWQARMQKAAEKAKIIGEGELNDQIRKQIEEYRDPENLRPTAAIIYQQIEDAVLDNSAAVTFNQVVDHVRRSLGMSKVNFLKKYKRSQRAFDAAAKDWKQPSLF